MTQIMSTRLARGLLLGSVVLIVSACTSMGPNPDIAEAQRRLSTALIDEQTADRGQADLNNAKLALNSAQMEWRRGAKDKAEHQLLMGQTYIDLAETRGQQAKVEADNTRLAGLAQMAEKDRQLAGKDAQIAGQDRIIASKNKQLGGNTQELVQAQDQLRGYKMTQTDRGSTLVLLDVSFETGKSDLLAGSVKRLQPLINYLRLSPTTNVHIDGYTDSVGGFQYNQILSLARANSVKAILLSGGVSRERIQTVGSGIDKPVASNTTLAGRQSNRRVEITLFHPAGM